MSDVQLELPLPDAFDRREVERAWADFIEGKPFPATAARKLIVDSWTRCRGHGIDPKSNRAPHVGSGDPLAALIETNAELLTAANHTWDVLCESLAASESVFVVSDPNGVLLDVRGNEELVAAAAREHVGPGYDWSETASGTNAVGTAIVTKKPTIVRSAEHYCQAAKIWDCAASPVRDLTDGTLLGILDVTSIGDLSDNHTLALAVTAAHQIEHTLHSQELARSVQLLNWYRAAGERWGKRAAVLVDRRGRIVTASKRGAAVLGAGTAPFVVDADGVHAPDGSKLRVRQCVGYRPPADVRRDGRAQRWDGGVVIVERDGTAGGEPAMAPRSARAGIDPAFAGVTTNDAGLIELMRRAQRMARANSPILLTGETGSGKELFARAIHDCSSVAGGPFVAVNSGTLSKELAASELLGYEAGAFTGASDKGRRGKFEEADGGTLFLDEIGELPLDVQVHLLRVLQDNVVVRVGGNTERQVDVRVIAATNRDLEHDAEAERFRTDLYYRLKVLNLNLPPLRERRDDITLLVDACLRRLQGTYGLGSKTLSPDLIEVLEAYAWPGNVRELHGLIESMYILSDRPVLTTADLPAGFPAGDSMVASLPAPRVDSLALADVERDTIAAELARGENLSQVARHLGISRSTLYRKMKQYGLRRDDRQGADGRRNG